MASGVLVPSLITFDAPCVVHLEDASPPVPTDPTGAVVGFTNQAASFSGVTYPSPDSFTTTGLKGYGHDFACFDRIHVIPRTSDLGSVISEQQILVEVWNAFHQRSKTLDDITVTGPAGITVIDHLGVPSVIAATQSEIFTVSVAAEGDPQIDNVVTWEFIGIETERTGLWIIGFRVVPFPYDPNMSEPVTETFGYLTNVISSFSSMEQRIQLRAVPVGTISYAVVLTVLRDVQQANAILFGNQPRAFGVARWPFRTTLASDATTDDLLIYCDTTDIPFEEGGLVMLWTDPFTWEVQTIDSVASDHLVLVTGVRSSWTGTVTTVVPMVVGRLSTDESFTWESLAIGSQRLSFDVDGYTP